MALQMEEIKVIARDNILTTNELCVQLNITRQYVSILVKKGVLTPFLVSSGKRYYWWKSDVETLLQENPKRFKNRCESSINGGK